MKIFFPELTFEAAHYIPDHSGKCKRIHGHTYFVRNLNIDVSMIPIESDGEEQVFKEGPDGISIDFGEIKDYFKEKWDHKFIIPKEHEVLWTSWIRESLWTRPTEAEIKKEVGEQFVFLWATTAEVIAYEIQKGLLEIVKKYQDRTPYPAKLEQIHFELWEGPHQAVVV